MAKTSTASIGLVNIIGLIVGLIMLIVGGVLVAISKLATVDPNPYLSTVATSGVMYALVLAIGFVIFVAFLTEIYEIRKGL